MNDKTKNNKTLPPTKKLEDKKNIAPSENAKKLQAAIYARKNALYPKAHELLSNLLKQYPNDVAAQKELSILFLLTENYNEAIQFLLSILKQSKDSEWILFGLAECYKRTNRISDEIDALKNILANQFNDAISRRLFDLQKNSGDVKGALQTIINLRSINDHIDLETAQAKLTALLGNRDEALKMAESLLIKTPLPRGAIELYLAIQLGDLNNPEGVLQKFEPMVKEGLSDPIVFVAIAKALHRMELHNDAIDYLKKAIAIEDFHPDWLYDISLLYRQLGRLAESQDYLMKSIRLNPLNSTSVRVYGVEHKYTLGEEAHQQLNYLHAHESKLKDSKKVELYMALAKAYEDFGELKTAFTYYEHVSHLQAKLLPYKHSGSLNLLKMTSDRINQKTYHDFSHPRCESDKPVFVLGMPRSGTSLVEQVIASHPHAHGAGEIKLLHRVLEGITINTRIIETKSNGPNIIPTFIKGIDLDHCRHMSFKERGDLYLKGIETLAELSGKDNVMRVVDKMPGNYFWTSVIPFILPNAKIIYTERHPLDNCLSLYRIYFPDGMPWSYDLTNLGKVYRSCYEHMKHCQSILPEKMMIKVNYEVMVNDFENQAKNIISHTGLTWDEACLKFYETDRQVKTASLNQVRKPIYATSVGRWKKYEDFLKPLIQELGPIIKEYEDLIDSQLNRKT
jgi:tetratricopeptide (TPR) repeat protein